MAETHFRFGKESTFCGKWADGQEFVEQSPLSHPIKEWPTCEECAKGAIEDAQIILSGELKALQIAEKNMVDIKNMIEAAQASLAVAGSIPGLQKHMRV